MIYRHGNSPADCQGCVPTSRETVHHDHCSAICHQAHSQHKPVINNQPNCVVAHRMHNAHCTDTNVAVCQKASLNSLAVSMGLITSCLDGHYLKRNIDNGDDNSFGGVTLYMTNEASRFGMTRLD